MIDGQLCVAAKKCANGVCLAEPRKTGTGARGLATVGTDATLGTYVVEAR